MGRKNDPRIDPFRPGERVKDAAHPNLLSEGQNPQQLGRIEIGLTFAKPLHNEGLLCKILPNFNSEISIVEVLDDGGVVHHVSIGDGKQGSWEAL
jgi:hypothetical protein